MEMTFGKELLLALSKARSEMDKPRKSGTNSHQKYNYAKYDDMVEASTPALKKNGIEVVEFITNINPDLVELTTMLAHLDTMQFIKCAVPIKKTGDDQAYGKALTYAKKYSYSTLVGIPCPGEDDADAGEEFVTQSQATFLFGLLKDNPVKEKKILERCNIKTLNEVFAKDFQKIVDYINEKPKAVNGN